MYCSTLAVGSVRSPCSSSSTGRIRIKTETDAWQLHSTTRHHTNTYTQATQAQHEQEHRTAREPTSVNDTVSPTCIVCCDRTGARFLSACVRHVPHLFPCPSVRCSPSPPHSSSSSSSSSSSASSSHSPHDIFDSFHRQGQTSTSTSTSTSTPEREQTHGQPQIGDWVMR